MIRGEPAIGRDQSREPCLYSVEPYGVPTMKQSYASAGKAPRRRVHSLSGIAAIAGCGLPPPRIVIGYPAHQAQSGAEPCLSFLVLESAAHSAGRSLTPSGTSPVVTRRHSAISSLRASATIIVVLRAPLGPSVPRAIPLRQRTIFLEHQEAPRQLDQPTSYPRIAGLGQALLSAFRTALVGRSREPGVARHRSSISKLPRQDLLYQHVRRLDADTDHPGERPHHRMRPCIWCR